MYLFVARQQGLSHVPVKNIIVSCTPDREILHFTPYEKFLSHPRYLTPVVPCVQMFSGIFLAILGRGPRAFLIGKISDANPEFGKFSEYSKLIIFSNLT